ncbi:hypothetical protein SNE40_002884 [Patella caerulea]
MARNNATKVQRNAHRHYEKQVANDIKTNPNNFWRYVKSKTQVKTSISILEKEDGTTLTDNIEKAIELNNYFSGVFTSEDISTIPKDCTGIQSELTPQKM